MKYLSNIRFIFKVIRLRRSKTFFKIQDIHHAICLTPTGW